MKLFVSLSFAFIINAIYFGETLAQKVSIKAQGKITGSELYSKENTTNSVKNIKVLGIKSLDISDNDVILPNTLSEQRFLNAVAGDNCSDAAQVVQPPVVTIDMLGTGSMPKRSLGQIGDISLLSHSPNRPYPGCNFQDDFNDTSQGTVDCFYRMRGSNGCAGVCMKAIVNLQASRFHPSTNYSALYFQAYISNTTSGDCGALTPVGECKAIATYDGSLIYDGIPVFFDFPQDTNIVFRLFSYSDNPLIWSDQWRVEDIELMAFPKPSIAENCALLTSLPDCGADFHRGCNLGAKHEQLNWAGPSERTTSNPPGMGLLCGGQIWDKNAAPYYHCFIASQNNPKITFKNIGCSSSSGMNLKLAAFSSCESMTGTSVMWLPENFKGCNAGSVDGEVELQTVGINTGDHFIVVVDTEDCNFCRWEYSATGVLPLNLVSFNAKNDSKQNFITWQTKQESDIEAIVLDKSIDGIDFTEVYRTESLGSIAENNYHFVDKNPVIGENYYQLKFITTDGKVEFSKIISVGHFSGKYLVASVFPNPTSELLNIKIESPDLGEIDIKLLGLDGKLLKQNVSLMKKGVNIISYKLDGIETGTYLLETSSPFGKYNQLIKVF